MSVIRPFAAIMPDTSLIPRVSALPYDVYSSAEARVKVEADDFCKWGEPV